jgi:hypothetical protein
MTGRQVRVAERHLDIAMPRQSCHFRQRPSRLHSSLGHLTPNEFVGQRQVIRAAEEAVCSS